MPLRIKLDAGLLARTLGDDTNPVAPGELGEFILPTLDISPFLLPPAAGATLVGDAFTPLGSGRLRSIAIANPGAGVELIISVPAGVAWQPVALRAEFAASATVATRIPRLVFQDALLRETCRMPNVLQVSSAQTVIFTWARGINSRVSAGGLLEHGIDLPFEFLIGPGGRLLTSTSALQAGDTWINVTLNVREHPA